MVALPARTRENADSTSGCRPDHRGPGRRRRASARGSCPAGISTATWTVSSSVSGWKVNGRVAKAKACRDEGDKADEDGLPAMDQRPAQDLHIEVHQPAFAVLGMALGLEEVGRDHRRDHSRDGEADQHRRDDGEAEADEILAGDAGHQATGRKTATIEKVVATTARPISSAASIDA